MSKKGNRNGQQPVIKTPKTFSEFKKIHNDLMSKRYIPLDMLKGGQVRSIQLGDRDPSATEVNSMATSMGCGAWSNGPLAKLAWSFDSRDNAVKAVTDKDNKPLGLGYVEWGPNNATPSVIPPLAQSSPYTAAPLKYIADLTSGLGVRLMYRFPDGELCDYKDAGDRLLQMVEEQEQKEGITDVGGGDIIERLEKIEGGVTQSSPSKKLKRLREAYDAWQRVWEGYEGKDGKGETMHVPGAREFLEDNNLDLHLMQCEQDDVMLDIYFPTVGFQRGRAGRWYFDEENLPKIVRVGFMPASITRLEKRDAWSYTNHCYVSDQWRTNGAGTHTVTADDRTIRMYPAAMPQNMLQKIRQIVRDGQKIRRIDDRPLWIICPTYYPSLNKPYYPQPAWWSIFTSKAFDFSATILYDKYKQRENNTTWSRVLYISLDYLQMCFADEGIAGDKDKQQEFIDQLDQNVEQFLQHRENMGKTMRQFMWIGPDGKEHHNVEIVDVKETTNDAVKAGKEELLLSTNPIFLALQVDPRLVGVPMVEASNGGTAQREMTLLKQQQLNPKQRLYLRFMNQVAAYNGWTDKGRAEFHIKQLTTTTLDRSKTGQEEVIAGEGA
jgi:hypothetical protein